MRAMYLLHIVAGSIGLLSGYVALFTVKGALVHRRSGMAFVYAMLAMCLGGLAMAVGRGVAPATNVPAALLTAYLVVTALTTVRPQPAGDRRVTIGLLAVAAGVAATSLVFGFEAVANGGTRKGMPAFPFFLFGVIGALAVMGDIRVLRSGPLSGARRIARHLWRMSFALFIAALSFFIGQAKVIPQPLRIRPLLAVPVVLVLGTMLYWLWRVRLRKSLRGLIVARVPDGALALQARI